MSVTVRWKDRKKGRVYFLDVFHDGQRKKVTIGNVSLREAREAATKVERELLANGWRKNASPSLTLDKFINLYLTESKALKSYSTYRTDRYALGSLRRFIGDIRLSKITEDDIERFRIDGLSRISPASVNVSLRHLKAAFGWARRKGFIKTHPMAHIKLNRVPRNTHLRYLNETEIQRLRDAIGNDVELRQVVDFGLWTGLRRDEIVHLQWSDVNFDRFTITVQNKAGFRTKSGKSRVVPMSPPLVALMTEMARTPHTFDDRVFKVNYWTLGQDFRKAVKRAGFDGHVTLHMLRHTFASFLIMADAWTS